MVGHLLRLVGPVMLDFLVLSALLWCYFHRGGDE